jgi:hypothetical protein
MAINVTLKLDKKSQQFLKNFPDKFKEHLRRGILSSMRFAEGYAKRSFGASPSESPNPPGVITGHLRRSVVGGVEKVSNNYIGYLGSNVKYARALEEGVPERSLDERPFIRPALEKNLDSFYKIISNELLRSL